jgi:hypothetical protein
MPLVANSPEQTEKVLQFKKGKLFASAFNLPFHREKILMQAPFTINERRADQ